MTTKPIKRSKGRNDTRPVMHRGISSVELLVAFTLLLTVLSVAAPLTVRHGRLLQSQRDYRLAVEELSNQMARITSLPSDKLPEAIKELSPSPFLVERLRKPEFSGEIESIGGETRVTLQLSWNEPYGRRSPLSLAAWVFAPDVRPSGPPAEDQQ